MCTYFPIGLTRESDHCVPIWPLLQDDGNRQQTARRLHSDPTRIRPFRKYDNMTHEVVKYAGKKVTLDRTFVVFEGSEVVL